MTLSNYCKLWLRKCFISAIIFKIFIKIGKNLNSLGGNCGSKWNDSVAVETQYLFLNKLFDFVKFNGDRTVIPTGLLFKCLVKK